MEETGVLVKNEREETWIQEQMGVVDARQTNKKNYTSGGGGGGFWPPRPPVLVCMGCILYAWRIRVESVLVSMLLPVHFLLVPVAVPVDFLTVEQVTLTKKDYLNNT